MYVAEEFTDAASRPIDAEQDRLLALYAVRRRARKAKGNGSHTLTSAHELVTFRVAGDRVTITRTDRQGAWSRKPIPPASVSRAEARAEYRRLLDAGMWRE